MTRINVVPPWELSDAHLLAEHRELKRIPNCIAKGRYSLSNMPSEYTLWTGHVKFFYDKLGWLYERYTLLYKECIKRGFNVTNFSEAFKWCPAHLFGGYIVTEKALEINRERITLRTKEYLLKISKKKMWKRRNKKHRKIKKRMQKEFTTYKKWKIEKVIKDALALVNKREIIAKNEKGWILIVKK